MENLKDMAAKQMANLKNSGAMDKAKDVAANLLDKGAVAAEQFAQKLRK